MPLSDPRNSCSRLVRGAKPVSSIISAGLSLALVSACMAQVPGFAEEFDGPALGSEWSVVNPATHDGFDGSGYYLVRGPHGSTAGINRTMGGQGDFTTEVEFELGPFFLSGSGGTQADLKIRFTGSGESFEVVLNSFRSLRASSSELGGNLEDPITLDGINDGDSVVLQFIYEEETTTMTVNYAINEGAWQLLASASGISPAALESSDIVLFKFGDSETTLPHMKLDHYEVVSTEADLLVQGFELIPGTDDCLISWGSAPAKSYNVEWSTDLFSWQSVVNQVTATPPLNTMRLDGLCAGSKGFFRIGEQDSSNWPHGDYCTMLSQEIQGKKHAFLAGNKTYYIGGQYSVWNLQEHETLGLTHPFHHDLRGRGVGIATDATTGTGHDFQGWEFYRDAKIAYGTVIVNGQSFPNPVPERMYWRPDRVICEYEVDGVDIREEKFIALNDVACTIITASEPIEIQFAGQSYVSTNRSVQTTSTVVHDTEHNMVHVSEGGTALARPVEGTEIEGALMYDGMSTVISTSDTFTDYSAFKDEDGRQQYAFKVACGPAGVALGWAMHDTYADARDRLSTVLADPAGHLDAKTAHMEDLLANQIPYFRCSDPDIVNIYYYLWAIYLMYYIDVGEGWEVHPHTQTAVNNFMGMHRFDANFQIKVGAWVENKDYYAYGNVLIWSALLPHAQPGGKLPDNMGQSWHSPLWETAIEHVVGAWDIYEHSGDLGFIEDIYEPYFKPLFWDGIADIWGAKYDAVECLKQMAVLTGNDEDVAHWHTVGGVDGLQGWMDNEWERATPNYWGNTVGAVYPPGSPDEVVFWTGMAYMRNEWFPESWAKLMTDHWAVDEVAGFNSPVPPSLVALQDIDHVFPDFASAPDLAWYSIMGMYDRHVGKNANVMGLGHLKKYNLEWGIPVAPESYDSDWGIWGDQYSNFNAGKILLILGGIAGLDYSIPDGTFEIADNMPDDWTFMELKVPVTQPGQTDWVDVRVDRSVLGAGAIEKTITVTGNPLATLKVQPWVEEKSVLSSPNGADPQAPPGHLSYSFSSAENASVTITLQE